jgi:ribose-phosphate pyrophosphokinase
VPTLLILVPIQEHIRSLKEKVSVIAGPSSSDLATCISKKLDANLVPVDVRIFEDGESKLRMGKTEKKCCIVVQSTYPPTDRHLLQVLMMIKKCADRRADMIYAVIPYLAYTRQDREFLDGEVVSMALLARLIEAAGTDQLITVDVHSSVALSHFTIDVQNISSIPILANYTANNVSLDNPIVVSPDSGGIKRAAEFAKILKVESVALRKFRHRGTGRLSIEERLDTEVEGRDVILVDDMITSGSSIAEACKVLKKFRSGKVYAVCAHALLIGNAMSMIKAAGVEDVIATNSVPNGSAKVDLSSIISENLKRLISSA